MLSHERLDVYQRSIEFLASALRIAEKLPRGQAPLADQLRRAAMSIPLNIAEGSGRSPASADRTRFRGIARGSAMECGAILERRTPARGRPRCRVGPGQVTARPSRRDAEQDVVTAPVGGGRRG